MKKNVQLILVLIIMIFSENNINASNFISADHPFIQYFGRWDFSDPKAPTHAWPGVYIYAEFEGTSLGIKMNDNYNYYNVFIDGELREIFHPDSNGINSYELISGLEEGRHTILLTKRNETMEMKFSFYGFILDDGKTLLKPEEKPQRKIEFIGDSYTSAQGNEYDKEDKPAQDAPITNIYEGFGPVTARNYNAQYQITSRSGYGLVCDWEGNSSNNLLDIFDRTILFEENPKWIFDKWIPEIVVIGLGLNDYSGFDGWENPVSEENTVRYKSKYHEFISTLRNVYPNVKILAVAPHVEWLQEKITEIVTEEKELGFNDVYYSEYPFFEGGYVYGSHPNVETHHKIAELLIQSIDANNLWK